MKREHSNLINRINDFLTPNWLRDNYFITNILYRIAFGKSGKIIVNFRDNAPNINHKELRHYYQILSNNGVNSRKTDCTEKSIRKILKLIKGKTVADISCGTGYLIKRISRTNKYSTTGVDFNIGRKLLNHGKINFVKADIHDLPFRDNSFDTVISTHTLEHSTNIIQAISELRRITKRRLIIVIPKQRPYRFTPDLHLHYFPYWYSVNNIFIYKRTRPYRLIDLGGDWLYFEG